MIQCKFSLFGAIIFAPNPASNRTMREMKWWISINPLLLYMLCRICCAKWVFINARKCFKARKKKSVRFFFVVIVFFSSYNWKCAKRIKNTQNVYTLYQSNHEQIYHANEHWTRRAVRAHIVLSLCLCLCVFFFHIVFILSSLELF